MKKYLLPISVLLVFFLITASAVTAAPFYDGKTIRIIVGFSPGGGFDAYARLIARHMGKYIPGKPAIIVENMTGAGGLISVNYVYKVAKPDGLTIGHPIGSLFLNQVMGEPGVEFDARKFEYLGAYSKEKMAYIFTKASGITNINALMSSKTLVKVGGSAPGTMTDNALRVLKKVLGFPIQIVSGYKGGTNILLAMEGGEVAGTSITWDSLKVIRGKDLANGEMIIILQGVPKPLPDLPDVPLVINFAKTDEARHLVEAGLHIPSLISRPLVLPPGTSKERVQILREAFNSTMKDKEFLEEAKKAKFTIAPVSAAELEENIDRLFKFDPATIKKLKEILYQ